MRVSDGVTDLEQIREFEHQAVEHLTSGPAGSRWWRYNNLVITTYKPIILSEVKMTILDPVGILNEEIRKLQSMIDDLTLKIDYSTRDAVALLLQELAFADATTRREDVALYRQKRNVAERSINDDSAILCKLRKNLDILQNFVSRVNSAEIQKELNTYIDDLRKNYVVEPPTR